LSPGFGHLIRYYEKRVITVAAQAFPMSYDFPFNDGTIERNSFCDGERNGLLNIMSRRALEKEI